MRKKIPGEIVFDPTTQPGYAGRRHGVNFNRFFGDAQVPLQGQAVRPTQKVDLPKGLVSLQLPQVFPSRRKVGVR